MQTVHVCNDGYHLKYDRGPDMAYIGKAQKVGKPLYLIYGTGFVLTDVTWDRLEAESIFKKCTDARLFERTSTGILRCLAEKHFPIRLGGLADLQALAATIKKRNKKRTRK